MFDSGKSTPPGDDAWKQASLPDLMRRLAHCESIINRGPAVVFLWRQAEGWPVEYVSDNIRRFGFSPEDFLSGRVSWISLMHPEDLPRLEKELAEHRQQGTKEFKQDYRLLIRTGGVRWVEHHTYALADAGGNVTHFQGVIYDITAHKVAQEELRDQLRQQDERLKELTAQEGEVSRKLADESATHKQTEQALRRLLKASQEAASQALEKEVFDHVRSEDKLHKALSEIKTLTGLLSICFSCKKIKDDDGAWVNLEHFIQGHSNARFTHCLCPDCGKKLYPDFLG